MDKIYNSETGCCKRFDPTPWMDKEIVFKDKLFTKSKVMSIFHIPLNFDKVIVKQMDLITKAGALPSDSLLLSDENSLFGSDLYVAVTKDVPGAQMTKVSGTFLSKVFEGPYQNMGNWIKEMESYVKAKGKKMSKMYFFYTTCPACAKAYGKNYTVMLAQV